MLHNFFITTCTHSHKIFTFTTEHLHNTTTKQSYSHNTQHSSLNLTIIHSLLNIQPQQWTYIINSIIDLIDICLLITITILKSPINIIYYIKVTHKHYCNYSNVTLSYLILSILQKIAFLTIQICFKFWDDQIDKFLSCKSQPMGADIPLHESEASTTSLPTELVATQRYVPLSSG